MKPRAVFRNLVSDFRRQGAGAAWRSARSSAHTRYWEWRLGVDTTVGLGQGEGAGEHGVSSGRVSYGALFDVFGRLPMAPDSHLVDIGCGAGRALLAARALGMRRVTGVEIQPRLAEAARRNLAQARHLLPADSTIFAVDARDYVIPPDADLIYLFRPFTGPALEQVVGRIEASLRESPRPVSVLFLDDDEFRALVAESPWVRLREEGVVESHTQWPVPWGLYQTGP